MFDFFKKDQRPKCPIPEVRRQSLEADFDWLVSFFGAEPIKKRRVLIPHHSDFPIRYNGEEQTARDTLDIIARQMEIDPNDIELLFSNDGAQKISTGSPLGTSLYTIGSVDSLNYSSQRYYGKGENGKYHMALEQNKLQQPESMVATLANKLSHIKLLGKERSEENNEQLAELTTIVFGLGVFNANAALSTFQAFSTTGWLKSGYLTEMDWGYALALFARLRKEDNPEWSNYLCMNVKADFAKSRRYLSDPLR